MTAIDYGPLTAPYDKRAADALARQLYATVPTRRKFVGMGVAVDVIGAIGFSAGFLVLFFAGVGTLISALVAGRTENVGVSFVMIFSGLVCGAFTYWLIHRYFRSTGSPELWWRLDRFAAANGLIFAPWSPQPAFPSAMFHVGANAATYSHIRREGEGFFNIGNLYYQTGRRGNESFDKRWGFVAIQLEQTWPAMLLDSTENDRVGMNGIPLDLAGTKALTVQGVGAEEFVLWASPADLDRGRQVFSPALVETLASASGDYDAHLVDNWLFIFSRTEFAMDDPALLAELFGFIDIVRAAKV